MNPRLHRGDPVRLRKTAAKWWSRGVVRLASDTDPSSVIIELEDGLQVRQGLYVKFVALTVEYQQERATDLLTGTELEIEVGG
jgi:hypothetical protein